MAFGDLTLLNTVDLSTFPGVRGIGVDQRTGYKLLFLLYKTGRLESYKYEQNGVITLKDSDNTTIALNQAHGIGVDTRHSMLFTSEDENLRGWTYTSGGILTPRLVLVMVSGVHAEAISLDTTIDFGPPWGEATIVYYGASDDGLRMAHYLVNHSQFTNSFWYIPPGGEWIYSSAVDPEHGRVFGQTTPGGLVSLLSDDLGIHLKGNVDNGLLAPVERYHTTSIDTDYNIVLNAHSTDGFATYKYNETTGEIALGQHTLASGDPTKYVFSTVIDDINKMCFIGTVGVRSGSYDSDGLITLLGSIYNGSEEWVLGLAIDTDWNIVFESHLVVGAGKLKILNYDITKTSNIPILTKIENAMKRLIEELTILGGYFYDWGECNLEDAAQASTFPKALIYLVDVDNLDDVDTGAHAQSYHQMATFRIIVRGEVVTEPAIPNFAINPEHNKALDDLLELFGNNYSLDGECDVILFSRMERDIQRRGDVFKSSEMSTIWHVYYQQDRVNPLQMG